MEDNTIGQKIFELRRQNGYSQEELANMIGASRQSISKWEVGATLPSVYNLRDLSVAFSVSMDYFLTDNKKENANEDKKAKCNCKKCFKFTWELVCLFIVAALVLAVARPAFIILINWNSVGIETVHVFEFTNVPAIILIGSVMVFIMIVGAIISNILKNKKG